MSGGTPRAQSPFGRAIRQAFTIARRDFIATVFTPTFLVFLFAPVLMLSFGAVGSIGAASMADGAAVRVRIVAVADAADARALTAADKTLRTLFLGESALPRLLVVPPERDAAAQARAQFTRRDIEATAVLYGPLDRPHLLHAPASIRHARYLLRLADQVTIERRTGTPLSPARADFTVYQQPRVTQTNHGEAAFLGVFGIFLLTILLAGQAVGTMAEERSNKVIEVLAAAVPLESVFLGKLLGMFGVAGLFIAFWGTIVANVSRLMPAELVRQLATISPAVGGPMYATLFLVYFAMAYMVLGAIFLGVGAQASTPRELQMMSLPITIVQVTMFGLAQAAASHPGSTVARIAEIIPFSSPFAMTAHAANRPELWPHALAIGWQALWVAIVISVSARLFRRGVLQSGSPRRRWFRRAAIDNGVN